MGANQLCRIVFRISSQIGRDGLGIWVMCQLTEKLFETSLVWWNLQVRIFVQILGDTSIISEHLWEWSRNESCIESKEGWHFEYFGAVFPESSSWIIVESKIVHSLKNSSYHFYIWSQLSSDNDEIGYHSRSRGVEIALLLTTNGVMCCKYVSQKRNETIDNCQSYKMLSIFGCKWPWLNIRLKYTYWIISVKLDWLPDNSKKWTID